MKTTLTKADLVGWYGCNYSDQPQAHVTVSYWWDGEFLRHGPNHRHFCGLASFTNFRLLVEAPAEYFTGKQRAEQFFTDFVAHPVCDMQDVFERHLLTHVASLVERNKLIAAELEDVRDEVRNQKAAATFHRTLMEETMNVARGHGWQPGSSLANWLKGRLPNRATDQHIGTQDTSDIHGLGDGDDTWEAPGMDDRYEPSPETLPSKAEILDAKCVPDSPGEWHHRNGDILRVWESKHPDQSGNVHLRGQFVFPDRCTTLAGAHISKFASYHCDWVKAVPPTDPCEAVKSLRQLARDVHEACDKASIPTHHPKMARAALAEPLSIRDRLNLIVTRCHDGNQTNQAKDGMIHRLNNEINLLRIQLEANIDECLKREGKLSAIGRLVLPLAGETLVNAVVRKLELLNQLLGAIKPEGDPVGTVGALRAQRDQLRREVAVRDSEALRLREKIESCRRELQHVRNVANELQGVIDRNIKAAA